MKVTHCKECNGKGIQTRWWEETDYGRKHFSGKRECKSCNGTGHIIS